MWQDKLKEIIYILENSDVNEIEVNFWGRKYRVSKQASVVVQESSGLASEEATQNAVQSNPNPVESENTLASDDNESFDGEDQLSPMPGTFYSAPTPEDEPFVSKGDVVKKGQVLCIIEAMKIMNEIESEFDGTIMKVNVNNGDPVEYNQPLFVIKPS
ncbi:MAG: acetyl-CoA carboxylase biotin carboxyl carrier protein [Candidatus Neomarinimicrobiota bacterium]|jgi:acetyl-CoA carboxylase biotin carboxyl carrier protein